MDTWRRRLEAERDEELARLAALTEDYDGVVTASRAARANSTGVS